MGMDVCVHESCVLLMNTDMKSKMLSRNSSVNDCCGEPKRAHTNQYYEKIMYVCVYVCMYVCSDTSSMCSSRVRIRTYVCHVHARYIIIILLRYMSGVLIKSQSKAAAILQIDICQRVD